MIAAPRLPPLLDLKWQAWRIISTRFPAVNLFEELADPADWEALAALEAMTNPRFLDEVGDLSQIRTEDRVNGPGASYLMAPFTHPRPGRFSTAAFGALYAGSTLEVAIAETRFHQEAFCRNGGLEALDLDLKVLSLRARGAFRDLRGRDLPEVYALDDYTASQALAARLREAGAPGVAYDSVRLPGGECLAAWTPKGLSHCRHVRYLCYRWDGQRISDVFEKRPFGV